MHRGAGFFKVDLPRIMADESNDLTPIVRQLLGDLYEDLRRLEKRIAAVARENQTFESILE